MKRARGLLIAAAVFILYAALYLAGFAPGYYCGTAMTTDGPTRVCAWSIGRRIY